MIPYIGGKSYLSSWVIGNFPEGHEKLTYCEVFGGGGWVLFKKEPSFVEIYNDLNKNLVTLFTVIKDNFEEFNHKATWTLHSREMYTEARKQLADDQFLNEVERAMSYAIAQIQSFSGSGNSWGYQITADKIISGKWLPFLKRLELINARLKKVQIESLDFGACIEKYDKPYTLFYCDPPYVEAEHYYKKENVDFKPEDHLRLAEILSGIKGKFVLSYYDHPLIRELYKSYNIISKETAKHSCGINRTNNIKKKPRGMELLIKNF